MANDEVTLFSFPFYDVIYPLSTNFRQIVEEINYRIVQNDICFLKLGRNVPIDGSNNSRSRPNRHFHTEAGCEGSKDQI